MHGMYLSILIMRERKNFQVRRYGGKVKSRDEWDGFGGSFEEWEVDIFSMGCCLIMSTFNQGLSLF